MRAIHWAIIFVALILTCLWFMFTLRPVSAAECVTPEQYEQMVNAHGGKIVGSVQFKGEHTDSLLVIQGTSLIAIVGFKSGCLVTNIIPLDTVPTPSAHVQPGASKTGTGA